ncbi:MAG: transcriptional regulator [Alphaproteobacteria bacterium]|nr:transcriptional regulator [Alphaproteobacteria bacterium]
MTTVTITVESLDAVKQRMAAAFRGKKQGGPRISFVSHELMWRILTPKRWAILKAMLGTGPLSGRAIAPLVKRDVKGVLTDLQALAKAGVIDRDETKYVFPYDAVHVDFMLKAA